jgi:hypothetical protein
MTTQGRSLDDLPLAAYTRGVKPDERLEELEEQEAAIEAAAAEAAAMAIASAEPGGDPLADIIPEDEPGSTTGGRTMPALALPNVPALPEWLAHPRANIRDPRLMMTGVIGVGVVLLAGSVLLGSKPTAGATGPDASASARPVAAATVPPPSGDATVEVSGKMTGEFTLTGATGTGPPSAGRIAVTWMDSTGSSLAMAGPASPGTRTTDAAFSITWTTLVDGTPRTFTSATGECTVGMALQPKTVTGSFVCKKLKSDDGKLTIDVRGTYRT